MCACAWATCPARVAERAFPLPRAAHSHSVFDCAGPITLVNNFGSRLRHVRLLRRLTQKALAEACGLSQGTIGNYETDSRRNPKDIFRIADALRIRPAWLARGTGPMELESMQRVGHLFSGAVWPFPDVDPARIRALTAQQRKILEKNTFGTYLHLGGRRVQLTFFNSRCRSCCVYETTRDRPEGRKNAGSSGS